MLPGREFFGDPDRCGLLVFQVKCVSRYWGLGLAEVIHRMEEAGCSIRICLVPWEWEQRVGRDHN